MQHISKRLEAEINKVLEYGEFTVYKPKLVFHNPNTEYKETVDWINAFDIEQDFLDSYMTKYTLNIQVTYSQYLQLQKNAQDLECTIILYPYDTLTSTEVVKLPPTIIKTKVIMNKIDLSKAFNNKTLGTEHKEDSAAARTPALAELTMNIPVYLVDPGIYDTRHMQINAILHNVTVEDVINWAAYQFGFEKIHIVKPTNTIRYNNLVIPPMQDIGSLFPYLQRTFGIYSTGLGYFVMGDELYMYPQYDKDINNSYTNKFIHIINAPKGQYHGTDSYSRLIDGDQWIVSITSTNVEDATIKGTENDGNVHVSSNPDNSRDGGVVINKNGKVVRPADNITVIQNTNSNPMRSKAQVLKYVGQRSNIFTTTTQLAANDGVYMNTGWVRAKPMALLPGQCVLYHYDDKGDDYTVRKGRILKVSYNSKLEQCNSGTDRLISFMSVIYIYLEPDTQQNKDLV